MRELFPHNVRQPPGLYLQAFNQSEGFPSKITKKLVIKVGGDQFSPVVEYAENLLLSADADLSRVGKLKKAKYSFGDYASYADMMKYMRTIEFYYPNITKIVRLGVTHEGKPIEGMKVGPAKIIVKL